jgi:hypothetical protein
MLVKLSYKDILRAKSIQVFLAAYKQKKERNNDDLEVDKLAIYFRDFRKNVFDLKQISKSVRAMYEDYNEVELANKDLEELNDEVELLLENTQNMIKDLKNC